MATTGYTLWCDICPRNLSVLFF